PVLNVRQAIGRVEEQSAGSRIERDGDGIQRKIPAAEVLHNRGPANFRASAWADIMVVASGGNSAFDLAGKENVDVAGFVILGEDLGAAFFQFAGHLRRIAFHGEVEVAKG